MIRRFIKGFTSKLGKASQPSTTIPSTAATVHDIIVQNPNASNNSSSKTASALYSDNTEEMHAAHKALQEAVKELSEGQSIPITAPSPKMLQELTSTAESDLDVTQLEQLARAYFEGREGVEGGKNQGKAVELWQLASDKGSIEGKYSLAQCYKDGIGIEKNSNVAFQLMKELADKENFNLAHVIHLPYSSLVLFQLTY
jgi:TPR repeat protein